MLRNVHVAKRYLDRIRSFKLVVNLESVTASEWFLLRWHCSRKIHIHNDFIKRNCQWVSASVVIATHTLQCARAHNCIGYHWLSVIQTVNRNLCLIDGVEKVVGWSLLRWNSQSTDLYPSYNPPPFM